MSHAHEEHHSEDQSVNTKIAVFFIVVLAALFCLGMFH